MCLDNSIELFRNKLLVYFTDLYRFIGSIKYTAIQLPPLHLPFVLSFNWIFFPRLFFQISSALAFNTNEILYSFIFIHFYTCRRNIWQWMAEKRIQDIFRPTFRPCPVVRLHKFHCYIPRDDSCTVYTQLERLKLRL